MPYLSFDFVQIVISLVGYNPKFKFNLISNLKINF